MDRIRKLFVVGARNGVVDRFEGEALENEYGKFVFVDGKYQGFSIEEEQLERFQRSLFVFDYFVVSALSPIHAQKIWNDGIKDIIGDYLDRIEKYRSMLLNDIEETDFWDDFIKRLNSMPPQEVKALEWLAANGSPEDS